MLSGKKFLCTSYSACLFPRGSWGCSGSPRLVWCFVDHTLQRREWWLGQGAAISAHTQSMHTRSWILILSKYCITRLIFAFPVVPWSLKLKSQNALISIFYCSAKCSFVLKRSSRNGITAFHIYCTLVTFQKIVLACTQRIAFLVAN